MDFAQLEALHSVARKSPITYWEDRARDLKWFSPWKQALNADNPPFTQWFVGGQTNICFNALDRHVEAGRGDRQALIWEANDGSVKKFTYEELLRDVSRVADAMRQKATLKKGDRIIIFMPMVPEAMIVMLAAWRIGVIFSVIFSSFETGPIKERILHTGARAVFTANGFNRGPKNHALKSRIDEAVKDTPVEKVIVLDRDGSKPPMKSGRDIWWNDFIAGATDNVPAEKLESNDPSYILYTSGSTGGPKGMVHSTGGYMTGVYESSRLVFQLRSDDIFWCTADIGWVTGHSYTVLAPLLHGCTTVMFEGMPSWPHKDRIWEIIDRHKITVLYTAPTAINDYVASGSEWPDKHNLSSLRLLGTVGEPITETAWNWYFDHIGKGRCPIVDTWWQTETGAILISAVPGATEGRPSWAGPPLPGVMANVRQAIYEDTDDGTKVRPGDPVANGDKGLLTIDHPWPSRALTMWGGDAEQQRFIKTYFPGGVNGPYVPMDLAFADEENNIRILGRADDVIIVAGHNIGTGELENAIREHPGVAKVIVVARPDERTGQAIVAFVVAHTAHQPADDAARQALERDIRQFVKSNRAAHWAPAHIEFVPTLMTTLSGKHMRRFYRQIAQGDVEGLKKANKATLAMPEEFDRLVESFGLAPALKS